MKCYVGNLVHAEKLGELEVIERGALVVNADGVIETVCRDEVSVKAAMSSGAAVVDLGARFLFPGLIDCHAHAPQYAQLGLGTDLPLLEWLEKYTFPTEAKFADPTFARRVYADAVSRALSNGTTTCLWFGSQHLAATKVLADVCYEKGFHGFVGKTCMDRNSPDFYVEASAEASLRDALELVRYVQGLKSPTVTPIITPRFAISCTPQLMTGLGKLAREHNLMIQSHISENEGEIAFVKSLHPESKHYADVYHSHGLLTDRTVMAHACHLLDDEVALLASTGASVAHCPNSNFTLCSGIAPVRKYLRAGIKVGLSTDMSGGYAHSMWEAMRAAMYCSAAVHSVHPEQTPLSFKEACYLATMGGAAVIGMQDRLGSFAPGKWFSAQIINPLAEGGPIDSYNEPVADLWQKCVYLLDDRCIEQVFVKGRKVK